MSLINVSDRKVGNGAISVGVEMDNAVEEKHFFGLPVLDVDQVVDLRWVTDDKLGDEVGDITLLEHSGDEYVWTITNKLTQFAGRRILAYIRITAGTKIWSTNTFVVGINAIPPVDATVSQPNITAIDQMIASIQTHTADMAAQETRMQLLDDETKAAHDNAVSAASQTGSSATTASQAATAAQGSANAASGSATSAAISASASAASADRSEAIYNAFAGLELSVDVSDGTLNLYGTEAGGVIDIVLNDRTLEVYKL